MPSKPQPVTTNSSTSIPGWLTDASKFGTNMAEGSTAYTPYSGEGTAGMSPAQMQALGLSMKTAGTAGNVSMGALPGYSNAMSFGAPQMTGASVGANIQGLLSPYIQSQVDATNAQLDKNTTGAVSQTDQSLAAQHAFGGDRQALADAEVRNQGDMTKASTDAGIYNGGYNNALTASLGMGTSNQDAAIRGAGVNLAGANGMTGLGTTLGGLNLQDLQGLLSTGGVAQGTQQAADTFGVGQYNQQYQSQFQQMQALAQMLGAVPHDTSSTSTKTSYTNPWMQAAGLGLGLASIPMTGGASLGGMAAGGLLSGFGPSSGNFTNQ